MSDGFTVQCFRGGQPAKFARTLIWTAFAAYASKAVSGWDLTFPNGSTSHLNLGDDEQIDGFGILRPGGGTLLFDAVFSVLSKVPSIMIWSSDGRCVVAGKDVISELPNWLLEALPAPEVVASGQAINDFLIRTARVS